MLTPGETFAGYIVVRELGAGGMGAVYLVRHPRLPRMDALKVLRRELCTDVDFTRRFLREADVVAGLSHRNVVPVLDRGEHDGQLWLTMPYVEGSDAEAALFAAGGRFSPARAVHVVAEVAGALDAAHRQGLVHRDVKPANILIRPAEDEDDEQVFLTDFGIAKPLEAGSTRLTRTGMVIATFDYASPEQVESRPLSSRSDVYSLGCVLYKLLTGGVPFPGDTLFAALHGHVALPPPRPSAVVPDLPAGLDDVVARAMAKDPADRFPTCRALAIAARAALSSPAPAPPTVVHRVSPSAVTFPTLPAAPSQTAPWHPGPPRTAAWHPVPQPPRPSEQSPATHPSTRSRARRRRPVAAALVMAMVVVGALTVLFLNQGDEDDAGTSGASPTTGSPSTQGPTPAQAALAALPRSAEPVADATVVVVRNDGSGENLFLVDSATGDATQLTSGADDEHSPAISPDRQTLAYLSTGSDGTNQLLAMPADGGGAQALLDPLPDGCTMPLRPAWDPVDPTRLALPCAADDGSRTLTVVTLDGAVVSTVDTGPYFGDVAFSPDGSEVAYWAASAAGIDGGALWAAPADGSGSPRQISDVADGVDADPEWSTAGIVFRRAMPDGSRSVCVVQSDGSALQVLTEDGYDEDPAWSPDGSRIVYKSREDAADGMTRMWTMAADGSDAAVLGEPPDGVDEQSEPAWGVR